MLPDEEGVRRVHRKVEYSLGVALEAVAEWEISQSDAFLNTGY